MNDGVHSVKVSNQGATYFFKCPIPQCLRNKGVLCIKIHKDFILEDSDVEIDSLISAADELADQHKFQKWKQDSGDVFYVTFDPSTMAVDRCIAIFRSREWKITIKGKEQKRHFGF